MEDRAIAQLQQRVVGVAERIGVQRIAAMYSIRDPASEAFQLIQSVVNQEMLHLQLVCNLCNAFGRPPEFKIPV